MAVIEVRVERRRRHGVDGVAPDERLDVVDVGVGGVLGRRARPERTLWPGALAREQAEVLGAEALPEGRIGELRVGDRGFSPQALDRRALVARDGGGALV